MEQRNRFWTALAAATLTLAAGCKSPWAQSPPDLPPPPTPEELAAADIGDPPDYDEAVAVAEAWLGYQLLDPGSAQVTWTGGIERGWFRDRGNQVAWQIEALVNAKNAAGGYAGAEPWRFFIRHGDLFAIASPHEFDLGHRTVSHCTVEGPPGVIPVDGGVEMIRELALRSGRPAPSLYVHSTCRF